MVGSVVYIPAIQFTRSNKMIKSARRQALSQNPSRQFLFQRVLLSFWYSFLFVMQSLQSVQVNSRISSREEPIGPQTPCRSSSDNRMMIPVFFVIQNIHRMIAPLSIVPASVILSIQFL